jgi:hypothetical protein
LTGVEDLEANLGVVVVCPLFLPESRGFRARLGLPVSDAMEVATWLGTVDSFGEAIADRGSLGVCEADSLSCPTSASSSINSLALDLVSGLK